MSHNWPASGRRNGVVSNEINASLILAPLSRGMTHITPPGVTRDVYRQLPVSERAEREQRLKSLPPSLAREPSISEEPAYEASQPPLYYWLMAIRSAFLGNSSLLMRVWALRVISMLLGSLAIPIGFILNPEGIPRQCYRNCFDGCRRPHAGARH